MHVLFLVAGGPISRNFSAFFRLSTSCSTTLARDAFVRTNRRTIPMMFVVCLGRACIVITRCMLARNFKFMVG